MSSFIFSDTTEKAFQQWVVNHLLLEHKYIERQSANFDREFCVDAQQLLLFIEQTQPQAHQMIMRKGLHSFWLRFDKKLSEQGIVDLLRNGIKHYDQHITLFYPKPNSNLNPTAIANYQKNVFSLIQELVYSTKTQNRLDVTLFINGIPIATLELKNPLSGQTVSHAIRQYQTDRDPREKLFNFARCLVHFAVDTDLVYMTTKLQNNDTFFLPFNKGLNNGTSQAPFGAGNPKNPVGFRTHYLWENILSKDVLSTIIRHYAHIEVEKDKETKSTKKKLLFPRYHQLVVVQNLLQHAQQNGTAQRYLIQHSAGSGKSNSIAWLAHQLVGMNSAVTNKLLFDCVIIVTDRIVLDNQLSKTVSAFEQMKGTVMHITGKEGSKTAQLQDAIANRTNIIICTIQTFPFLLKEAHNTTKLNFAIIIDEAHSSQSSSTASQMDAVLTHKNYTPDEVKALSHLDKVTLLIEERKMMKNASYFAFTATPKNKTLEMFGVAEYTTIEGETTTQFSPFHLYSMKQAIEEEFIIDVLQYYTTYQSYYKLIKTAENNPEYDTRQAQKELRKYIEGNEFAIAEKAKIMIDHFCSEVRLLINNQAKAMVVTKSIEAAIKYKQAFDQYLTEKKLPFKAIVAFSGDKELNGISYNEIQMNNFEHDKNDIPKNFKAPQYRFLIVAEKYQTGFDEPLLHTMYVDKVLSGVQAVQTLSRLNRAKKPHKKDTFVLDFVNTADDIKQAFDPYYTTTILSGETDPNKLNDLNDELDNFEVYTLEQVEQFMQLYINNAPLAQLEAIINQSADVFKNELDLDQKINFKAKAKSFLRVYAYLSRILDFNNLYWEQLWWYLKRLVPKLYIEDTDDLAADILQNIDMDSYRPSKQGTEKITLSDEAGFIDPIPVETRTGKPEPNLDTLENIVKAFNEHFGDIEWTDKDKTRRILIQQIPNDMLNNKELMLTILYDLESENPEGAKLASDTKLAELIFGQLVLNTDIYKKFNDDKDFQRRYKEFIFDIIRNPNKHSSVKM